MNIELKRQIDSWTEADKHQNVIDFLEGISPANRDFEEIRYWHELTIIMVSMKRH